MFSCIHEKILHSFTSSRGNCNILPHYNSQSVFSFQITSTLVKDCHSVQQYRDRKPQSPDSLNPWSNYSLQHRCRWWWRGRHGTSEWGTGLFDQDSMNQHRERWWRKGEAAKPPPSLQKLGWWHERAFWPSPPNLLRCFCSPDGTISAFWPRQSHASYDQDITLWCRVAQQHICL
jgi:hypothetical protein